jgi:predicted DNA-binding transcriptional regulator AlpA
MHSGKMWDDPSNNLKEGSVTHDFVDQLLNEKQLAVWLGISLPSLQRMRSVGTGPPFVQLSRRRIGYKKSSVERWLEARTITRVGGLASEQVPPTSAREHLRRAS